MTLRGHRFPEAEETMGSTGNNFRCPICGRRGPGYALDRVGYPICTPRIYGCMDRIGNGEAPLGIAAAGLFRVFEPHDDENFAQIVRNDPLIFIKLISYLKRGEICHEGVQYYINDPDSPSREYDLGSLGIRQLSMTGYQWIRDFIWNVERTQRLQAEGPACLKYRTFSTHKPVRIAGNPRGIRCWVCNRRGKSLFTYQMMTNPLDEICVTEGYGCLYKGELKGLTPLEIMSAALLPIFRPLPVAHDLVQMNPYFFVNIMSYLKADVPFSEFWKSEFKVVRANIDPDFVEYPVPPGWFSRFVTWYYGIYVPKPGRSLEVVPLLEPLVEGNLSSRLEQSGLFVVEKPRTDRFIFDHCSSSS